MTTALKTENDIYNFCFNGLIDNPYHGYGSKRITLKVPDTISCKIPCSGFGYKDEKGSLFLGVRLYIDQGDYVKFKEYDKNYSIYSHFCEIIIEFDKEFSKLK